jgi:hypothetical protein
VSNAAYTPASDITRLQSCFAGIVKTVDQAVTSKTSKAKKARNKKTMKQVVTHGPTAVKRTSLNQQSHQQDKNHGSSCLEAPHNPTHCVCVTGSPAATHSPHRVSHIRTAIPTQMRSTTLCRPSIQAAATDQQRKSMSYMYLHTRVSTVQEAATHQQLMATLMLVMHTNALV